MFLGLDLGTSNVKAIIVDRDASTVAQGSAPVTRSTTPDGGVLQDLEQIWEATRKAVSEVTAQVDAQRIEAIGLCSQGGALQLLDANDRPLGPIISWLDTRGTPFDHQLEEQWGRQYLVDHLGCHFSTTTLGQIARLWEQAPDKIKAAKSIGWVGDLIVGRLCGRRAHDPTNLSLAMLYNPSLDAADPDVLDRLHISDKRLPDLLPATVPAGQLRSDVAHHLGLPGAITVSPAVHDQYAATIGAGAVDEGDVLVGTGTAWVVLAVMGRLVPPVVERAFVCAHPVAGRYGQLSSLNKLGTIIEFALGAVGMRDIDQAALDALLASVPPGADGLSFQLKSRDQAVQAKENSNDPMACLLASGTFSGGDPSRSYGHLLRAVFEGLACELADYLDRFAQAGFPVSRVILTGPAARGSVFPTMIADAAGRPVARTNHPAVGARGAAIIGHALVDTEVDLRSLVQSLQTFDEE